MRLTHAVLFALAFVLVPPAVSTAVADHPAAPRQTKAQRSVTTTRVDQRVRVERHTSATTHYRRERHRHHDRCGHHAMSNASFRRFLSHLDEEPFSSGKLRLVRMVARHNDFTSAQVGAVVDAMTFGSNKVEVAVALYPHVVDPGHFHRVFAAFTFESNERKVRQRLGI